MHLSSYPKVYNLGHRALVGLTEESVVVQEKVDGSQFSFGVMKLNHKVGDLLPDNFQIVGDDYYVLKMRSRGADVDPDNPPKMFKEGVEYLKKVQQFMKPGLIYRCEYLSKPKHNTLAYDRVPKNGFVLFDVEDMNKGPQHFENWHGINLEAMELGIEPIPMFYVGMIHDLTSFKKWMSTTSFLGGQDIEGVVIKNYSRFGVDGKTLMGKHVSEAFKEVHQGSWKDRNPTHKDILQLIGDKLRTPARWEKAVQHLRDRGQLLDDPKDIGPLMQEVNTDILQEEGDKIKEELFKWAWRGIGKNTTRGLAQWYKDKLAEKQFTTTDAETPVTLTEEKPVAETPTAV